MDEDFIRERAEDNGYSEEATEDLVVLNEFTFQLIDFIQELIDEGVLSDEQEETAVDFIDKYESGVFED